MFLIKVFLINYTECRRDQRREREIEGGEHVVRVAQRVEGKAARKSKAGSQLCASLL